MHKSIRAQVSLFFLILLLSLTAFSQGSLSCDVVVQSQETQFKTGKVPSDKALFFKQISKAIETNKTQLEAILLRFNNVPGTKLEFDIVKKQLTEEVDIELYNLNNTPVLENIAVYASTNVPLYTLVSHGFMTKAIAKNVWFRTPETTRDVYIDLYNVIKNAMPDGSLDGLNLLVDSRDVQYDNFNKMYVMGMNKKGTRIERPPSEMVIFTGNPATAKKIVESNTRRVKEDGPKYNMKPFKQVFLGFGAGINPIIVPESAITNLDQAVHLSMEPIRINCGQDCMAADFYAVSGRVVKEYVSKLVGEIRKLKPGHNTDINAGYTPLTMSKNFSNLIAFRDKYKQYLVNPDATIDENSKLVSPHVFVFPYHMFKEVELYEHFGPIFTIYTYKNESELDSIARDERVQSKAMYATILGGNKASKDITSAAQIFRQTRHHVIVNNTLFGDIHPNMPFGGKGPLASMIVNFEYNGSDKVSITTGHRPKLISSEANLAFGKPQVSHNLALLSSKELRTELDKIIQTASQPASQVNFADFRWKKLKFPQTASRPRGISEIRRLIKSEGLFIATDEQVQSRQDKLDFYKLYGAKPYPVSSIEGQSLKTTKGVVLHPSGIGDATTYLNQVRGSLNPHLGWGHLNGLLSDQKYLEYVITEAIEPGRMPHTESFKTLKNNKVLSEGLIKMLSDLRQNLDNMTRTKNSLSDNDRSILQAQLNRTIETLFHDLRRWFPEGAFLKNFGEFGTADLGNQITTFASSSNALTSDFLRRFESSLQVNKKNFPFISREYQKLMKSNRWEISTAFVNQLLINSEELLVQSRVKIAKTEMGFPIEVRVDFIDGESVHSRVRFGSEYLPDETKEAAEVLNQFFKKAPEPLRYMSGGADIAKLMDGSWVIIEFNFGSASGTLSPRYFPIDSNLLISNLQGHATPLIQYLENNFKNGLEAQLNSLNSLKNVRPLFWKANGLSDLSVSEEGKYYRDRYLQEWEKNPTRENAEIVMNEIRSLLADWNQQEDIQNLILGAEYYLNRKLKN